MFTYTYVSIFKDPSIYYLKLGSGKFWEFKNSTKLLWLFITSAKLAEVDKVENGVS